MVSTQPRPPAHVKSKPTEDFIYTELYNAILERRLAPETKLGENSLAEYYGVSRTIIRQVLARLGHDRLVKLEPHRGAFIASLNQEQAKQIYAAWRLVESEILRDLAQSISKAQVASLRTLIADERAACEQQDIPQLSRLSLQFHLTLAAFCSNQVLGRFMQELIPQTSLAFFYEVRKMPICGEDEHSMILNHVEAGDAAAAIAAAMRHLDGIQAALNARTLMTQKARLEDVLGA